MGEEVTSLEQLLDRIGEAESGEERVSMEMIVDAVGSRSFGPFLLLAGLITLMPLIGDIPGMPTMMGLLVMLTAGQLLFQRRQIWLPRWMLNRSVAPEKLRKALDWLRRPARFFDRLTRPRLQMLVKGAGSYVIAIAGIVIAAGMPLMEVVPFSANGAGAALTAFGLSLIARDGLLALIAMIVTAGTYGLALYNLL